MGYRVRQYHKSTEQKVMEAIFKGLWWLISLPYRLIFGKQKGLARRSHPGEGGGLDRNYIRTKWQEIEQLMSLGHPSNFSRAVLEADKLLDHILKGYRSPGMTMGDRLKASRKKFSDEGYDAAWKAHKVRNELVHNSQFELMDYSARQAITNYHRAIKYLINF